MNSLPFSLPAVLVLLSASGAIFAEGEANVPGGEEPGQASTTEPISYDAKTAAWLFDREGIISRNDVLYNKMSTEPWDAMPTGGGDLSAMVRFDGVLHINMSKSDSWGYTAGPNAPLGDHYFSNVSPGHVRIDFGDRAREEAGRRFSQRLDLYHGRVIMHIGSGESQARLAVWGHPRKRILVVEIDDPKGILAPADVKLVQWRNTVTVGHTANTIWSREVHAKAVGPYMVSTGMQDYFTEENDPMLGHGTAVVLGTAPVVPGSCGAEGLTASMRLAEKPPARYHVIISAAVTENGDPLEVAQGQLREASAGSLQMLREEHQAWWRDYWGKSFLCFESINQQAEWLTAAYHVHLYTLGCVNRGRYPALWFGAAGADCDLADWVQEVRFNFLPLYAANRLEMARLLPDTISRMVPFLETQGPKVWGVEGLWMPETYLPWGYATDVALKDDGRGVSARLMLRWDPKKGPYGLFEHYNGHVVFLFTSGLEISHHYLTYYRYSGDEEFLRDQAYPLIRGVCEFFCNLLKREKDGRYHLDPANGLETWWMIRDPADTLDGIRAIFPEFIRLSEGYDLDADLRAKCETILLSLPQPSLGKWHDDGRVDPTIDAYAPGGGKHQFPNRINAENPALYRVFPFGLSGIGTPDHDRAVRTFECRTSPLWFGWAMDAIWAARLGLADRACPLLVEHARRFNIFPSGGWFVYNHTSHTHGFPRHGIQTNPFLDSGGCSATALNEILLQSHNGLIRVAPAIDASWSGVFQLRAEGGFLVAADIHKGHPRFAEIRSLLGKPCRVAKPWPGTCLVRKGREVVLQTDQELLEFDTAVGAVYILEPADGPLSGYSTKPVEAREGFQRVRGYRHQGLPGRD